MAHSKVVLAKAGSGKTYHIAETLKADEKNIVVTYTRQNVQNLEQEIRKNYDGIIPDNTQVLTFSSFVYRWLIRPFEPIFITGNKQGLISNGVEIHSQPAPQRIQQKSNPKYFKQDDYRHFVYNHKYYSSRMSKLVNKQKRPLQLAIVGRLSKYCDAIYFDELQDFIDDDFKLLNFIMKQKQIKTFAVGDFYQHSVMKSNITSRGTPFVKQKGFFIIKEDYINLFNGFSEIDENTLKKSRRVPHKICGFIRDKLNIEIESSSSINGNYHLLNDHKEIECVLHDQSIVKLVNKESSKYDFQPVINWSYSKGDTYKDICIILTKTFQDLFESNFSTTNLTPSQINSLYVAITRATHNVYFIKENDFRVLKHMYKK